jgi:hypothetical protein
MVWGWYGGARQPHAAARRSRHFCGGCAAHQQEQSYHLLEDPVQQPQSHNDDHARPLKNSDHRCSAALPRSGTAQAREPRPVRLAAIYHRTHGIR